nr:1,4-dihydroxy-2-naphthoate octaprenyltransferase [Ktedonobacteraceae bacterium]
MQSNDSASEDNDPTITVSPKRGKSPSFSHIVTADSVQAEEVPTIPLSSLQTLSTLQPEVAVRSTAATRAVRFPAPLVVQPTEYRRSLGEWWQVWWDGIRPAYVGLALMPVLLGSVLAWTHSLSTKTPYGQFHLLHFVATLVAVVALQIGANLVNDYYDYIKGVDTSNPLGPGALIQQGLIKPINVLNLGLVLLALGAVVGAVVAITGGFYAFLFGILGLLCAYFFSATSRSLSSLMLGELVSLCIYGPLLTLGAYLVQTGGIINRALLLNVLLYSLPLGLLAAAVVHVNTMRDVESDAQANKRTLASILGLRLNRVLYILLLLGAYAISAGLGIPHGAPHLILITFWTLPLVVVAFTGVLRADMSPSLHLVMRETLKIQRYYALLLVIALLITALLTMLPHLPALPAHLLPF